MQINFYSQNDEKLGILTYLGENKWGDLGWSSEDFSKSQVEFLVSLVISRKLNFLAADWLTVTLSDAEEIHFLCLGDKKIQTIS